MPDPALPPIDPVVQKLQAEVAELAKRLENPKKDGWDKLSAVSGLLSGIGFYATNVYNQRQQKAELQRKDQELLVAQIQTAERFIPHLASKDESVKSASLIAIAALGNDSVGPCFLRWVERGACG